MVHHHQCIDLSARRVIIEDAGSRGESASIDNEFNVRLLGLAFLIQLQKSIAVCAAMKGRKLVDLGICGRPV